MDANTDIAYGLQGGSKDRLCSQYLLGETSSTPCGGFASRARMNVKFAATSYASTPHPVWEFAIPKSELGPGNDTAQMAIRFHQAKKGYTNYPASEGSGRLFAKVLTINFKPTATAFKPALKPMLVPGLAVGGQGAREILRSNDHVISVRPAGDRVTFVLEAMTDTSNDMAGTYPQLDFAGIRVDVNQNGKVDKQIDTAYGISSGTRDQLCLQYLLTETSSTGCSGFPSKASLKVAFRATPAGSKPHPVWLYTIPKTELGPGNDLSHLTFTFHQAGKGYTRYPLTTASMHSFADALVFDVKSLQVMVAGEEQGAPVVVTHDTKPPLIAITQPEGTNSGEVRTADKDISIQGRAQDDSGIYEVRVNGEEVSASADGSFRYALKLAYGSNRVRIRASDTKDNVAEYGFAVVRESGQAGDGDRGLAPTAEGEEAVPIAGTYFALVVAVQDYADPGITDLDQPAHDAEQLKSVLLQDYTFDAAHVTVLEDPEKAALVRALEDLARSARAEDNVLIFFAGHGQWDEQFEQGYWLPEDAAADSRAQWISNSDIRDYIRAIRARHTLLISDACFSGGIFKSRSAGIGPDRATSELYGMRSRKAMTSGTLTEVPDRSAFLEYLTARLQDNSQNWLTADQLFYRLREAVINNSPSTPQYGVIFDAGDEGGEFVFVRRGRATGP